MIVRPMNDWVVVKVDPMAVTVGSIIVPDIVRARDTHTATVLAVGPGKPLPNGERQQMEVQPGDKVCFHRWNLEHKNGQAICHALEEMGPDVALIQEKDILFVWPPDEEHTFW